MNLSRNIVIEASAGTGKTYTLVQTILQALFQKNLPMDALVALTFTKKAAGEMKERIAAELQRIDRAQAMEEAWRSWGQPLDELKERARRGLETIDRAAVGTIHSYAFSLLKRFPLAAGISPEAEVDEKGVQTDDLFEHEWPRWLRGQLELNDRIATRSKDWLEVLEHLSLADIRALARRLCDFDIPLDRLPLDDGHLSAKLAAYHEEIRRLLIGKPKSVKSTRIGNACEEILGIASAGNWEKLNSLSTETRSALEESPGATKEWPATEIQQLRILRSIALNVLARGDRVLALATQLIKPFITSFRNRLLAQGYLSNNALLVLARDLVLRDRHARQTLKHEIRLIFVDEFQDTDPLQGELILFLAELRSEYASHWQDVKLEPGKLFLVGDPKQSIYRFRGADMGAYSRITQLVLDQGGERRTLDQSYRSHEQIIHVVNAAFQPLIKESHPISPAYQPLVPRRAKSDETKQDVELRFAIGSGPQSSEEALEREANDAADWILEVVSAKRWQFKDIALVFRATTPMPFFIEALRARNIPFVVEGERYFYRTPEVTDVLNLLRAIEDASNRLALAGFLRSPLGGFTDVELALLQEKNGLRRDKPLPRELTSPAHQGAWNLLQSLGARVGRDPLKQVLNAVYEDTYLLELAARSYHRDQTLANLFKLKRLMEEFAEAGETTLRGLLAKIDRFMQEDRLEGESPLADETYDAVRLLTIHKAKGLEFPVVWLPGLHRGRQGARGGDDGIGIRFDWWSGQLGISIPKKARNLEDFVLEADARQRDEAEELRVLYVAMTRPRELLILSGGIQLKQPSRDSFLQQLLLAWELKAEDLTDGIQRIGEAAVTIRKAPRVTVIDPKSLPDVATWRDALDPTSFVRQWDDRRKQEKTAQETRFILTPSRLAMDLTPQPGNKKHKSMKRPDRTVSPELAAHIGTLVHRFLEAWEFTCEKCSMPAKLRVVANHYFAGLGLLKAPFPDPKEGRGEQNAPDLVQAVEAAQRLLADFIDSPDYQELKTSQILGREVPFVYGLEGGVLMRGRMDILYRLPSGQVIVGDYKTDVALNADHYAEQGRMYVAAASQALGEPVTFRLIPIRQERPVSVPPLA
jgi:ATP-dependent helicase/nuclease subunit A